MKRKTCLSWAEKHVTLNGERFRREDWPLLIHILETIEANPGSRFVILGSVQTVKTLLAQLWVASQMQLQPSATLWYTRTDDQADSFVDLKLNPLLDSTLLSERAFFGDKNKNTRKRKQLPSGHSLEVLSAGPAINRQQRSAETIIKDEFWLYESEWLTEISNRRAAPEFAAAWREIIVTTAADEGHVLGKVWADSTQYKLRWKCEKCGTSYVPDFGGKDDNGGLKYECTRTKDGRIDKAATQKSARWECPHCGDRVAYSRSRVIAQAARQDWQQCNPHPAPRVFGWWIPDWLVRDWGQLAIDWEEAHDAKKSGDIGPLRKLILTRFAKPWKQLEQAKGEKRPRNIGAYKMREAWADEARDENGIPIRFLTVDVQKDHYVAVARAWGQGGTSRLLDARRCTSTGDIDAMARDNGIHPYRVFLDARWNQERVARIATQYGWRIMMGERERDYLHSFDGQRRIYSEPFFLDPFMGTEGQGRHEVIRFCFSKASALDRLAILREMGNDKWSAAADAPDWYWEQTEAHYTVTKTKPDGSSYREWHGLKDDHAGDCEAMQVVIASIAGILGVTAPTSAQPPSEVAET